MPNDFGLKIGIDGEKEFKSSLADINKNFKVLGSEMKLVASQFDKNDNSIEALTSRNTVLNKQIDEQKNKIDLLRSALKNSADSFGENDKRTKEWQIKLNNAEAELNKFEREVKNNNEQIKNAENGFKDASVSVDNFGDEVKKSANQTSDASGKFEKLGSVCKGVGVTIGAAFAAITTASIAAGKSLVDMTVNGSEYADEILTESKITGIATDKLQEYRYAAELVDVSTETLTRSMAKNIKSMSSASKGTGSAAEAYKKLGISVTDANGNLRKSDDVYWELINALGNVQNETERDALAMTVLGKSAQELNPLIEAGGEQMKEFGKQARDAGYVMSDDMLENYGKFNDELQKLKLGAESAKNALGTVLLPILSTATEKGVSEINKLSKGIQEADGDMDKIKDVISETLSDATKEITEHAPDIIELAGGLITSSAGAVMENSPEILDSVGEILDDITDELTKQENVDSMVEGFVDLSGKIVEDSPHIAAELVRMVPKIIKGLVNSDDGLTSEDSKGEMEEAGTILGKSLIAGIIKALPNMFADLFSDGQYRNVDDYKSDYDKYMSANKGLYSFAKNHNFDGLDEYQIQTLNDFLAWAKENGRNTNGEAFQDFLAIEQGLNYFVDGYSYAAGEIIKNGEVVKTVNDEMAESAEEASDRMSEAEKESTDKQSEEHSKQIENKKSTSQKMKSENDKMLSDIIKTNDEQFSLITEQSKNAGKHSVGGYAEGIRSSKWLLYDGVKDTFGSVIDWVKGIFDIHSPSRVFEELGNFTSKGFALGIADGEGDVRNAMSGLTDVAMQEAMRFDTGAYASAGKNVSSSFNIAVSFPDAQISSNADIEVIATRAGEIIADQISRKTGAYS